MHVLSKFRLIGMLIALLILSAPGTLNADPCNSNDPTRCRINIELHKSVVKRTDHPITRISIADPEIADYHLITPSQILLIAKQKIGVTNLIVWYDEESIEVFEIRVFVAGDLIQTIQNALKAIVPEADIRMGQGPNGLLLYGEVDGQENPGHGSQGGVQLRAGLHESDHGSRLSTGATFCANRRGFPQRSQADGSGISHQPGLVHRFVSFRKRIGRIQRQQFPDPFKRPKPWPMPWNRQSRRPRHRVACQKV